MEKKDNIIKFMAKVRFVSLDDDGKGKGKNRIAFEVNEETAGMIERTGAPVHTYEDSRSGEVYPLVNMNVYDSTDIYDHDGSQKFKDKILRYGDLVFIKAKPRDWTHKNKSGVALRLVGLFVKEYVPRGGFSNDELDELRNIQ